MLGLDLSALWGLYAGCGARRGEGGGVAEAEGEGGGPGEGPGGCLQMEMAFLAGQEGEQWCDISEPSAYASPANDKHNNKQQGQITMMNNN